MSNPRDTQFKGFGDGIWDEIIQAGIDGIYGEDPDLYCRKLIAQRAYDLVQHTIGYSLEYLHECGRKLSGCMGNRIIPSIPDMTEWPENGGKS